MTTLPQIKVRSAFKKCVSCFDKQPQTDPIPPPTYGARGRDYWYAQAGPSGLWYYDYFIQQSMPGMLNFEPPDWCYTSLYLVPVWCCQGVGNGYDPDSIGVAISEARSQLINGDDIRYRVSQPRWFGCSSTITTYDWAKRANFIINKTLIRVGQYTDTKNGYISIRLRADDYNPDNAPSLNISVYKVETSSPASTDWYNKTATFVKIVPYNSYRTISGLVYFCFTIPISFLSKTTVTYFRLEPTNGNTAIPYGFPSGDTSVKAQRRFWATSTSTLSRAYYCY